MFDGRFPATLRRPGAARRRDRRRRRGVALGRRAAAERRVQRGRRPPVERVRLRARRASTRCAAARGTSTPASHDMDLNGVCASLCFPSFLPGFVGPAAHARPDDAELALRRDARLRTTGTSRRGAAPYPGRVRPAARSRGCATRRSRPTRSARNAARGFKAVTFSEAPEQARAAVDPHRLLGPVPGRVRGDRDGRVPPRRVVGRRHRHDRARRAARDDRRCCSSRYGMYAAVDWLYSRIPVRFPEPQDLPVRGRHRLGRRADRPARPLLRVPARLPAHVGRRRPQTPTEVLQRNFWFCALDDPSACAHAARIGIDHLVVESDYPHADSTWPDTQPLLARQLAGVPDDEVQAHLLAERGRACSATRPRRRRPDRVFSGFVG